MFGLSFSKKPEPVALEDRETPVINLPAVKNSSGTRTLANLEELGEAMGIVSSSAGPVVTSKTAMQLAIVYRCSALISGAMATMPRHIFTKNKNGRERDGNNPIGPLLNLQPTTLMSAAVFWETITACMLLEGDGFAVIMRDNFGDPIEFLPINPNNMHVEQRGNRLMYFTSLSGEYRAFDQDDVLHFPGFGFNGTRSMSVVKFAARNAVGAAMAMQQFSSAFFKKGLTADFIVTKSTKWDSTDQEKFRDVWAKTRGGLDGQGKPITVAKGLDVKQIKSSAADSQLLQSREFENINICTAFGIPAFMLNQGTKVTAWGSGMAEMGLAFVRYTLNPHMVRFDQELNRKLFMRSDSYIETNAAGLMRGTLKERNEAYKSSLGGSNVPGYMAINEVRKIENLPELDNDIYNQPYDPRLVDSGGKSTPQPPDPQAPTRGPNHA